MSKFSIELVRARRRQRRLYLVLVASVIVIAFMLFIMFKSMNVITIEVIPEEISGVAAIELQSGLGFLIGRKVYTFTETSSLSVSAQGFQTRIVEILSEKDKFLRVQLIELPGKLQVQTRPSTEATRWLLDDELVKVGKSLSTELMPGDYALQIDSPYHEKKTVDINLVRGDDKKLLIELSPVQGEIEVQSVPGDMPVTIDGEVRGNTPFSGQLDGGKYTIQIMADDYETITDPIEVTNRSSRVIRNYRLLPKKAYLDIALVPTGGDLLINGLKVDQVSPVKVDSIVSNTIVYFKAGYLPGSRTVTLAPGEKKNIAFNLSAEMGKVNINSSPVAEVLINGKTKGKTPLTLSLLAVKQKITLSQKGYRSVTKTVTPSSKKTTQIDVTLASEQQARLSEAKPKYRNKIGMELQLFVPSAFKMGAARHEKGQRANEFERDIVLTRPFYAGVTEVTVQQYSRFKKPPVPSAGNAPVSSISWLEAAEFCNWLSSQEQLSKFYNINNGKLSGINKMSNGYRLLSEAEWEWLARKAGRKSQTKFTWGNEMIIPPGSGNIADESARSLVSVYVPDYNDGYAELAPVASFKPDQAGIYDLTGNVSEWVHDYYSLLPPAKKVKEVDPLGGERGTNHVIKGSNWRSGTLTELRASFREGAVKGRDDTGFRIARYLYGEE